MPRGSSSAKIQNGQSDWLDSRNRICQSLAFVRKKGSRKLPSINGKRSFSRPARGSRSAGRKGPPLPPLTPLDFVLEDRAHRLCSSR